MDGPNLVNSIKDIFKGDIVEFCYNGGSNPGRKRLVFVLGENSSTINTWDFEKQTMRTFFRNKMSDIRFLNTKTDSLKTIYMSSLPKDFTSTDHIRNCFEQEGFLCYVDNEEELIVAIKPQPKQPEISANVYKYVNGSCKPLEPKETINIYLNVRAGKCVGLYITDGEVTVHYGDKKIVNPTIAELKAWVANLD